MRSRFEFILAAVAFAIVLASCYSFARTPRAKYSETFGPDAASDSSSTVFNVVKHWNSEESFGSSPDGSGRHELVEVSIAPEALDSVEAFADEPSVSVENGSDSSAAGGDSDAEAAFESSVSEEAASEATEGKATEQADAAAVPQGVEQYVSENVSESGGVVSDDASAETGSSGFEGVVQIGPHSPVSAESDSSASPAEMPALPIEDEPADPVAYPVSHSVEVVDSFVSGDGFVDSVRSGDFENQVKERVRFLFVPTAFASFDVNRLASAIMDYALNFDIDLVVITGNRGRILPIINEFSQDVYPTTMIIQNGIVICKQDFLSRSAGYIEFGNFAVQLFQGEVSGDRLNLNPAAKESASYDSQTFGKLRDAQKPAMVFASPFEVSYYDAVVLPGKDLGGLDMLPAGSFVQGFEENGYVDAYNAVRYSVPTIGTAHPGFTYGDENGNCRIDFVLFKGMIPAFADTCFISGLSDLPGVRRYAIAGEMAL